MTAACLGVLLVAPQGATAAKAKPKPSKLAVTSLQSPPSSIGSGGRFTISGRVRNTGGRTAPALLGVTLRAGAHPQVVYSLGAGRVSAVRPGRTVAFRIRVTAPNLREALRNGFLLRACVKTSRKGAERCRTAAGRVVVRPTAPVTPTTPTPPPVTTPTDPTVYTSGARTRNDSLFPTIGNGGYDALHYDLRLGYTNILTRVLRGTATITAKATQNLKDFSLDFQGMPVSAVTVDGQGATHAYDLDDNKLVVTPAAGIKDATTFTVQVTYGGSPSPVIDPDASQEGWLANSTYGAVALGEPLGSQGWFPVNNVPYDKATYDITVTTPSTFQAMSNGRLVSTDPGGDGTTTYHWREGRPMAPYLATVTVGRLDQSASDLTTNPDRPLYIGIDQSINASSPANKATLVARQQRVPAILDWYGGYYGVPYPFEAAGGIVPRVGSSVGYVLETQTKPTYPSASANTPGTSISTIAHENAHQWFGNLVTLTQWRDIWLNEGLTEFSSWLWEERQDGGATTASIWDDSYATTSTTFWNIAPAGPPSAADIFDGDAMYTRGAMVAEGMRQILGESQFVSVMHDWLMRHAYANGTTEEFIALVTAADPARADRWTEYFRQWLYTPYAGDPAAGNKPQITPANFDTYVLPVVP